MKIIYECKTSKKVKSLICLILCPRFSLCTLKDFGFGKQSMESIIREEVDDVVNGDFCESFANSGKDVLIKFPFNVSVFNIIWRIVAGQRFEVTFFSVESSSSVAPSPRYHVTER